MVVRNPNIVGKRNNDDSFMSGELIKNAKVIPIGIPALKNPINRGIEEQEQNGVTTPSKAAKR